MRGHGGRIRPVEGVRGIAALTVLALHAGILSRSFTPGTAAYEAWGQMAAAVVAFFAVSGFVLWLPFARAHAAGRPGPSLGRYGVRRAARILPAYYVVLLVALQVFTTPPGVGTLQQLSWFGLFTQWLDPTRSYQPVGPAWSLNIELLCYVTVPIAAVAVAALTTRVRSWIRRDLLVVAAIGAASIGWKLAAVAGTATVTPLTPHVLWPVSFIDAFAVGMAVAVAVVAREHGTALPRPVRAALSPALLWPLWVAVMAVAIWEVRSPQNVTVLSTGGPGHFLAEYGLYLAAGTLPVVPVLAATAPRAVLGVLASRPLVFLGTVSYGVFLWHVVVMELVRRAGLGEATYLTWVVVGAAATVPVAWLSWRLVEAPAIALARGSGRAPTAAEEPVPVAP